MVSRLLFFTRVVWHDSGVYVSPTISLWFCQQGDFDNTSVQYLWKIFSLQRDINEKYLHGSDLFHECLVLNVT